MWDLSIFMTYLEKSLINGKQKTNAPLSPEKVCPYWGAAIYTHHKQLENTLFSSCFSSALLFHQLFHHLGFTLEDDIDFIILWKNFGGKTKHSIQGYKVSGCWFVFAFFLCSFLPLEYSITHILHSGKWFTFTWKTLHTQWDLLLFTATIPSFCHPSLFLTLVLWPGLSFSFYCQLIAVHDCLHLYSCVHSIYHLLLPLSFPLSPLWRRTDYIPCLLISPLASFILQVYPFRHQIGLTVFVQGHINTYAHSLLKDPVKRMKRKLQLPSLPSMIKAASTFIPEVFLKSVWKLHIDIVTGTQLPKNTIKL